MYTAFYGLREKPFALSPDPRFLYLAGSHREALAHLLYGIEQGEGFISVTGEVGTGKTTLCRTLLERLEGDIELAFLFNPSRTALELLQSICAEFGLPAEGLARRSLMAQLNGFLLEKKREGRRVLLIIDEAQTLSENTLEQVRLLSNLETSRDKLIQILLLGQPELDRKLDERGLRQLRQRISVRWQLDPLTAPETRAYVRHRVAVAAGEPKELFTDAALREVHRRTGGIPRLVNQLCDRSLLAGYAARAASVGPRLIRAAAKEIPDVRRSYEPGAIERPSRPWLFFAAACLFVGLGLATGLEVGRTGLTDAMQAAVFRDKSGDGAIQAVASGSGVSVSSAEGDGALAAVAAAPANLARLRGPVLPVQVGGADGIVVGESRGAAGRETDGAAALGAGLLGRTLEAQTASSAMATSERALLARFGRRVSRTGKAPGSMRDLEASFENRGLQATVFEGGSLALLKRLNHPVALALHPDRPTNPAAANPGDDHNSEVPSRWVAVLGFEADRVRVAGLVEGRDVTVPLEEFSRYWTETGMIIWERFETLPDMLGLGDLGGEVEWLQRSLAELSFYEAAPSGRFDDSTARALVRFQKDRGLIADGVAGPLTQIALFGQLERYPVPRLSSHGSSPSPNPSQMLDSARPDLPSSRPADLGERG